MSLIDEALSANATIADGFDPSRGGPVACAVDQVAGHPGDHDHQSHRLRDAQGKTGRNP
jgi:hypothetical protein